MNDDFATQFLGQVWPLLAFIVVMIGLFIATLVWQARRRVAAMQKKRAEIEGTADKKATATKQAPKQAKKPIPRAELVKNVEEPAPVSFSSILDEYDDPLEANRLDDLLAEPIEDDFDSFMDSSRGDDPLAELYQAREVAEKERELREDEEIVELASLLAGLADEEEEIVYHKIADEQIAVKLDDGTFTFADEHISILRDERDERLIVQLGETGFRTLLDDKEAKSTFTKIMKELSAIILKPDDNSALEASATAANEYHEVISEPVHLKLHGGTETTALELMSIMRDVRDAHLMLQMGEKAYRSLANEKQNKSNFTKIMKELAAVILTADDNPPQIASPSKLQAPQYVPDKVANIIRDAQEDGDEEAIPGVLHIPKMDDLPPTHSVGRFGRIEVKKPVEEVPELNIAEAIEKYLQYKIERAPQFQRRGIHIRPALSGGVSIDVDGKSYDFVDEIEDVEARNFIQQAINEWQDQH